MGSDGKSFSQPARTIDITRDGACMDGLPSLNVGEILGVQYGGAKARYRMVWVEEVGGRREGQIGVQLEPGSPGLWAQILDATPEQLRFIAAQSAQTKTTGF